MRFLTADDLKSTPTAFVERYKDLIGEVEKQLPLAPASETILEKFVFPLQNASHSYILGDYLGCISLCGMVAEMCEVLIFKIGRKILNQRHWDIKIEKGLFGREFERLGQERRVEILESIGFLDEKTKALFDEIREVRRRYLHYLSKEHTTIQQDAKKAFASAAEIMNYIMQPELSGRSIKFKPSFANYLFREGLMRKEPQESHSDTDSDPANETAPG